MPRSLSWLFAFVLLFVLADAQTASAGCFRDMQSCFKAVSTYDDFWDRFFGALDCELDFAGCVVRKLWG